VAPTLAARPRSIRRTVSTWSDFAGEPFCYLTTRGRVSGRAHRIEIWFALYGSTLYLLSGGRERSDWVRNLRATPEVTVELGPRLFLGRARIVEDAVEDERARRLVHDKYAQSCRGDLSHWRRSALPVAVDLRDEVSHLDGAVGGPDNPPVARSRFVRPTA
jgi:deazaflavin-dependent oxidoreductase (nitroreductase family)